MYAVGRITNEPPNTEKNIANVLEVSVPVQPTFLATFLTPPVLFLHSNSNYISTL